MIAFSFNIIAHKYAFNTISIKFMIFLRRHKNIRNAAKYFKMVTFSLNYVVTPIGKPKGILVLFLVLNLIIKYSPK